MVKWSCEVPRALLTGNLSQRLDEGWERFAVEKPSGHWASTSRVGAWVSAHKIYKSCQVLKPASLLLNTLWRQRSETEFLLFLTWRRPFECLLRQGLCSESPTVTPWICALFESIIETLTNCLPKILFLALHVALSLSLSLFLSFSLSLDLSLSFFRDLSLSLSLSLSLYIYIYIYIYISRSAGCSHSRISVYLSSCLPIVKYLLGYWLNSHTNVYGSRKTRTHANNFNDSFSYTVLSGPEERFAEERPG